MDPRALDASNFVIFALWIATAAALIANIVGFARRMEPVHVKRNGHGRRR